MSAQSTAADAFANFLIQNGQGMTIQNKTKSFTAGDYDNAAYANSGAAVLTTGLVVSLGKDDKQYLEQGVLQEFARKIYLASGVDCQESADIVFGAGSWAIMPGTGHHPILQGQVLWKTFVVKRLEV